jgi:general secretion pathway protein B
MSYILNALRKSERERQAMQPVTATDRISIEQPPARQGLAKVIVVLVFINVAILAYFLGIAPHLPQGISAVGGKGEQEAVSSVKSNPPVVSAGNAPTPSKATPAAKISEPRNQTPAPEKPVAPKKPAPEPVKPSIAAAQPVKSVPTASLEPTMPSKPKAIAEAASIAPQPPAEATQPEVKKPAAIARPQNTLPTLQDLPPDVRQSLPSLTLNVFSYSSTPAERFVMIDMVKYVPGQTIKNQVELQEILEDGIVVRYEGRVFKINR